MIQINKGRKLDFKKFEKLFIDGFLSKFKSSVEKELIKLESQYHRSQLAVEFIKDFQKNWIKFLIVKPDRLIYLKEKKYIKYEHLFIKKKKNRDVKKKLSKKLVDALRYEDVRDSSFMFNILKQMGVKSCPYCNANPIHAFETNSKYRLQTELDHYYPKSTYPYLSVSFYNLIPICGYCNRRKSNEEFPNNFYHPYKNTVANRFKFIIKNDVKKLIAGKNIRHDIEIDIRDKTDYLDYKSKSIHFRFSEKMELLPLYINYSDVASEILMKSKVYNKTRKKELSKLFADSLKISISPSEINSLILGNFVEEKDILKRPITKFMQDIAKDVELL